MFPAYSFLLFFLCFSLFLPLFSCSCSACCGAFNTSPAACADAYNGESGKCCFPGTGVAFCCPSGSDCKADSRCEIPSSGSSFLPVFAVAFVSSFFGLTVLGIIFIIYKGVKERRALQVIEDEIIQADEEGEDFDDPMRRLEGGEGNGDEGEPRNFPQGPAEREWNIRRSEPPEEDALVSIPVSPPEFPLVYVGDCLENFTAAGLNALSEGQKMTEENLPGEIQQEQEGREEEQQEEEQNNQEPGMDKSDGIFVATPPSPLAIPV